MINSVRAGIPHQRHGGIKRGIGHANKRPLNSVAPAMIQTIVYPIAAKIATRGCRTHPALYSSRGHSAERIKNFHK